MKKGDLQKWRDAFTSYDQWDSEEAREVQEKEAEVIIDWLKELNLQKYNILEIGCGNGYLGRIIIEELTKQNIPVTYTFADIVPECIKFAEKNTEDLKEKADLRFQALDVFEADKNLCQKSQEIILSTGYSSAATYRDAVPVVSKILKPGGILICDFVNHFSLPLFISKFPRSLSRLLKTLRVKNMYHYGAIGIKKHFSESNLKKIKSTAIRTRRNPLIYMFKKV